MKLREISLTKGYVTLVDESDYDQLIKRKWYASESGSSEKNVYAVSNGVRADGSTFNLRMHRLLLDPPKGLVVDHINGNTLDNRRANLRICTHRQNLSNTGPRRRGSSRYKGVCWNRSIEKWTASICLHGVNQHLGHFANERDAAMAYNKAAVREHGSFGYLNPL